MLYEIMPMGILTTWWSAYLSQGGVLRQVVFPGGTGMSPSSHRAPSHSGSRRSRLGEETEVPVLLSRSAGDFEVQLEPPTFCNEGCRRGLHTLMWSTWCVCRHSCRAGLSPLVESQRSSGLRGHHCGFPRADSLNQYRAWPIWIDVTTM